MTAPPRTSTSFDSLGTCTWALRLSSGAYVQDPTVKDKISFHIDWAYVWFSAEDALAWAAVTPWAGLSATPVRARP